MDIVRTGYENAVAAYFHKTIAVMADFENFVIVGLRHVEAASD